MWGAGTCLEHYFHPERMRSFPNSIGERNWERDSVPQAGVSSGACPSWPPADTPSVRNGISLPIACLNGV